VEKLSRTVSAFLHFVVVEILTVRWTNCSFCLAVVDEVESETHSLLDSCHGFVQSLCFFEEDFESEILIYFCSNSLSSYRN